MGIFSAPSSVFETEVEKATSEENVEENWDLIMRICDQVSASPTSSREYFRIILKRVIHRSPTISTQGLTLLDACICNCGRPFQLEVASKEFDCEVSRLMADGKTHIKVLSKLRSLMQKWCDGEFKKDSAFAILRELNDRVQKRESSSSSLEIDMSPAHKKTSKKSRVHEEDSDLAKAIALSLKKTSGGSGKKAVTPAAPTYAPAYPSLSTVSASSNPGKESKKARALYDFEAAEDNELTFYKGEVLTVTEDSDAHWWRGKNHRGEGLFPSSFVTTDVNGLERTSESSKRMVSFKQEVTVLDGDVESEREPMSSKASEIDSERIEKVLMMLHVADPEGLRQDPPELPSEEEVVHQMAPLIDQELQKIDRKHAELLDLSSKLKDALTQYHALMKSQQEIGFPMASYYGQTGVSHYQRSSASVPVQSYPSFDSYASYPSSMNYQNGISQPVQGPMSTPYDYSVYQPMRGRYSSDMYSTGTPATFQYRDQGLPIGLGTSSTEQQPLPSYQTWLPVHEGHASTMRPGGALGGGEGI